MVPLSQAIASNERIASAFPQGLVAVFVGGTSGVGEYTLKAFAKYAPNPRAYIVGRSHEAADRVIKECKQLNPDGKFEFIKADVSLLKNVDGVCRQIKSKETAINILFETQGTMAFKSTTSEGLPLASTLIMHSRMRFILNLLSLLQEADSLRCVVSVLAATMEGPIDTNHISGQGFSLLKWCNQSSSVETLLLEEAARRAPDGGIMRDAQSLRLAVIIAISSLLEPFIQTPPAECGERHLFFATSAMYAPSQGGAAIEGVSLDKTLAVAKGSNGQTGSGMYTVDNKGERAPPRVEKVLAKFREDGTAKKVWEYVAADFKKITGTEVAA